MRLRSARLCMNCEEVHDAHTCPACGSEIFVYLTRWMPTAQPAVTPPQAPKLVLPTLTERIVFGSAVLGVAAFWLARWYSRTRSRLEASAVGHAGELR